MAKMDNEFPVREEYPLDAEEFSAPCEEAEFRPPDPALEAELHERGKDAFAEAVAHAGSLPVSFVYQEQALGLGHAIHCAAECTGDDPFIVSLGETALSEPPPRKSVML